MQCQIEHQVVEVGRNTRLGKDLKSRHWHRTWIDETNDILWERYLTLKGEENEK